MIQRRPVGEVHYPDSDGTPMGENDVIVWLMAYCLGTLREWFRDDPTAYVSSNSFVYYQENVWQERVAPDLYFVRGVENRKRGNYKIWEEGRPPTVVFEFTTRSSRNQDLREKWDRYRSLGVAEYYLFDPAGEYLRPPFRAFHLRDGDYHEVPAGDSVFSPGLGLEILVRGEVLDFRDPATGRVLPTPDDLPDLVTEVSRNREQIAALEVEKSALERQNAELSERVRELQAELDRLRGRGDA